MEVRYHCTDQFWYRWDNVSCRLTRHVHNKEGTRCLPLSEPQGILLKSAPIFLGGAIQSMEDRCFTENLEWRVDLSTMRACRFHGFGDLKVRALCGAAGANVFIVLVENDEVPLLYVKEDKAQWLPPETAYVTRAAPCDVAFKRVALHMSHTKQVVVGFFGFLQKSSSYSI